MAELLMYLLDNKIYRFAPVDIARELNNGFLEPEIVKTRIRYYRLTDAAKAAEEVISRA